MVILDSRIGSSDLLTYFQLHDVHAELGTLEFGDAAFAGNGREGDCLCVVERKRLSDMVNSMRDRRFAGHQLPGLLENYDFVWLVVEGAVEAGPHGELMKLNGQGWTPFYTGSRGIQYSELSSYLTSLELRAWTKGGEPLRVKRTNGPKETVAWIVALYHNFQKTWNQHTAHKEIYAPVTSHQRRGMIRREPSLVQKMACQIPGVDQMAEDVAKAFRTPEDMVRAGVEEWANVSVTVHRKTGKDGKQKLGRVRAEKIVPLLRRMNGREKH